MQYYSYLLYDREIKVVHFFSRLFHQYIVDMYAKIESGRLNFISHNQDKLRIEMYKGLVEAVMK